MTRATLVSAALSGALMFGAVTSASAVTFDYNAYGGFVLSSHNDEPGSPPFSNPSYRNENGWYKEPSPDNNAPVPESNHYMDFSWGASTPNNQIGDQLRSGVRLLDTTVTGPSSDGEHISGQVDVNGNRATAGYVTHYNKPNTWEGTDTVVVHWHIDLFDGTPVPGDFSNLVGPSPEMNFRIEIVETLNQTPCLPGQPAGGSVCDDRFRVTGFSISDDPLEDLEGEFEDLLLYDFDYEETNYQVLMSGFFNDAGLTDLAGEFWSPENGTNTAYVGFRVVPEPSSVALLGLGLAGLVVASRRREQL